jgi:hypothetical protein
MCKVLGADFLSTSLSLAILLFTNPFPFSNFFPFQKPPTPKSQKPKAKRQKQKPQSKSPQSKKPKSKSLVSSFSESFISSGKQGGAVVLREGCDIVTGETCIPASLKVNSLGEAAVLHFPLLWPGSTNQPTDKHLRESN